MQLPILPKRSQYGPQTTNLPGIKSFHLDYGLAQSVRRRQKRLLDLDYIEPGDTADNNEERIETDRNTRD
jgi:hypothetical protein